MPSLNLGGVFVHLAVAHTEQMFLKLGCVVSNASVPCSGNRGGALSNTPLDQLGHGHFLELMRGGLHSPGYGGPDLTFWHHFIHDSG